MRFLIVLLVLIAGPASAADYLWSYSTFSDPSAWTLCDVKLKDAYSAPASTYTKETSQLTFSSETQALCKLVYKHYTGSFAYTNIYIQRSGTSCPSGQTYNSTLGQCEKPANPCESLIGQSTPFSKSGNVGDGFFFIMPSGASGTSNSGCLNSCEGSISGAKCVVHAGEPGTYTCAGSLYYSGQQCTTGSSGGVSSSDSTSPPPATPTQQTENNCGSWISTADGQSQTCVTTDSKNIPGTASSGASPTPTPSKSVDDKTQVTDKTTNPDGSSQTTVTTTTNNTYCTVGSCNTTTTTTTSTTAADPSGAVTSTSTGCTGPNCSKPTDSTGTGTGTGTGSGESIAVTGGGSATLVAKQQGSFDSANVHFDKLVSDSKQELRDKLATMKAAVTAKTSPTLSSSDGSLPCEPVSFGNGYEFDLCLTSYEGSLTDIRLIVLFIAALIAFYIVFIKG